MIPNVDGYRWNPDSRSLVVWGDTITTQIVDVSTGNVIDTLPNAKGTLDWSPDGQKLNQFTGGRVIIWAKPIKWSINQKGKQIIDRRLFILSLN